MLGRLTFMWKHPIPRGQPRAYGRSDRLPAGAQQGRRGLRRGPSGKHRTGYGKDKQMVRTENTEEVKQVKPTTKTVVATILWVVLFAAAMLFIAFAFHI